MELRPARVAKSADAKDLKSAKGAARTAEKLRKMLAPRSVLREFLKSPIGLAVHSC